MVCMIWIHICMMGKRTIVDYNMKNCIWWWNRNRNGNCNTRVLVWKFICVSVLVTGYSFVHSIELLYANSIHIRVEWQQQKQPSDSRQATENMYMSESVLLYWERKICVSAHKMTASLFGLNSFASLIHSYIACSHQHTHTHTRTYTLYQSREKNQEPAIA